MISQQQHQREFIQKIKAMDVLNLFLHPLNLKTTCLMCLKSNSDNTKSVDDEVEIRNKHFIITISIKNIVKNLFPSDDFLFQQICTLCMDVLIKMYTLIINRKFKLLSLTDVLSKLEKEISKVTAAKLDCNKIRINLSEDCQDSLNVQFGNSIVDTLWNQNLIGNCHVEDINLVKKNPCIEGIKNIKQHVKFSSERKDNATVCETCGKVLKSPTSLKSHLNCHKEKQCPYCSKTLKTHAHFQLHVKNHETPFKRQRSNKTYYNCHHCKYRSLNKNSLEAHMNKVHLQIRPHTCPICSKGFYKKSNLTEHVLTHKKLKPYTCEFCGNNLVSNKCLMEHLRLHSNERLYKCEVCSKKFVTSGRRSDHMKSQHGEKTECCQLCDKKYGLRKELNRHMKKIHCTDTASSVETISSRIFDPNYNMFPDNNVDFLGMF